MSDDTTPAARAYSAPSQPDPTGTTERHIVTGLARIGLATRHQAWRGAGEQGLTPTQGQLLALLRYRHRSGARLSTLAEGLAITRPTASDAVRALETKGLVSKTRAPEDARALGIALTDAGRAEAERAADWSDFLLDAVDALTPAERAVFLRGLVKMIRALQERGEIPVSRMCVTCRFFRPHAHDDPDRPHHCAFVDAPFGDAQLRLECDDHLPAGEQQAERAWAVFTGSLD
jgi:DNA-binding MarR family transcriptional regulator